jgi:hypothetical protein
MGPNGDSDEGPSAYQNHPALFLGLAVGIGLVVGVMRSRRSSRSSRAQPAISAPKPPLRERSPKVARLATTWEQITDALLGVATARIVEAIGQQVPGFKDQFDRQSATHRDMRSPDVFAAGR